MRSPVGCAGSLGATFIRERFNAAGCDRASDPKRLATACVLFTTLAQ